jgi:hypothetical protein
MADLAQPGEVLGSGVVTRLYDEVYARLPHGRLILVGEPGSGKTGAMILLLLAALERRAELASEQRIRVPVPVWLPLGKWDPATTSLQRWAANTINRDHPAMLASEYGFEAAGELLQRNRVALFLDGLDEMPKEVRALALKRVDEEARVLRIVLTSRTEEYRHAVQTILPDNTAVIELRPVRPAAAATYLLHGQAGPTRQRWKQLAEYLNGNPDSVAAQSLDNPLALSLTRDIYAGRDPIILTDPSRFATVKALHEHLIDQVLVNAYPEDRRAYATWWLAWIAHHMGTSRDLQWWDIPTWIPRWKLRVARGFTVGIAAGLPAGLVGAVSGGPIGGSVAALVFGLGFGVWFGVVARIRTSYGAATQSSNSGNKSRLGRGIAGLISGYSTGLATGLMVGVAFLFFFGPIALLAGLVIGSSAGLVAGLTLEVLVRFWPRLATRVLVSERRPRLARGLTVGLASGLTVGLVFGIQVAFTYGLFSGLLSALASGLLFGGAAALVAGLMFGFAGRLASTLEDMGQLFIPWKLRLIHKIFAGIAIGLSLSFLYALLLASLRYGADLGIRSVSYGILNFLYGIAVMPLVTVLIILVFEWLMQPRTGSEGVPWALVPRLPRRGEMGRIAAAFLLFLPFFPFVFLGLWATPIADSPSVTAASAYRIDRRSSFIYGITCGSYFAVLVGILLGISGGFRSSLITGLIFGFGIGVGVGVGAGQVPLVKLTELILNHHDHGRLHCENLLEDALSRQVLRQAGVVYQFRHAALQDHLAAIYSASHGGQAQIPKLESLT